MKRPIIVAASTAIALGGIWLGNVLLVDTFGSVGGGSRPNIRSSAPDPYGTPLLHGYRTYRDSMVSGDRAPLIELAQGNDGFLAYRASLALAKWADLDPTMRLEFYLRAAELRVVEPLARQENREFQLGLGAVAEAAGDRTTAIAAYAGALPDPVAVAALARLESDPYRLSNLYLGARLSREALDALDGRSAPSIEAPSYGRLGEHKEALDAYERWLAEQPGNLDALHGRAWSHFYLGNLTTAGSLFSQLEGASSLYARALIERREGNLERAVSLMKQTGEPGRLWLASSWLEAESRYREALPIYLEIARGNSVYADDSAYRALVLAERLGESEAQGTARQLIPAGSFFDLRLGGAPLVADRDTLPTVELEVQQLAMELARVSDPEAAKGELVFALHGATDEATAVALAETLQAFGEFRQSQRAAQLHVNAGSRELRSWRAAYPQAFPQLVMTEASSQDLEPELLWAIMRQESAFYPRAVSVSNAAGLMQVIPSTWDWLAELQKEEPGDRFDPAANIRYGSYYLRWLMNYHDGDAELVIPSYNRGQGYIRRLFESDYVAGNKDDFFREIDALETREYLQRVTVNYRTYLALYVDEDLAAAEAESEPQEIN
ncbi:MAG: transglycosylase SLT domain-containing protein [Trueperaceae bacterium]